MRKGGKQSFANIPSSQLRLLHCNNLCYNLNSDLPDYRTHTPVFLISGCFQEKFKTLMLYNCFQTETWQATRHNSDNSLEIKCHLRLRPKAETLFRNNELELGGRDGENGTRIKF